MQQKHRLQSKTTQNKAKHCNTNMGHTQHCKTIIRRCFWQTWKIVPPVIEFESTSKWYLETSPLHSVSAQLSWKAFFWSTNPNWPCQPEDLSWSALHSRAQSQLVRKKHLYSESTAARAKSEALQRQASWSQACSASQKIWREIVWSLTAPPTCLKVLPTVGSTRLRWKPGWSWKKMNPWWIQLTTWRTSTPFSNVRTQGQGGISKRAKC